MALPFGVYNTSFQKDMAIVRTRTQWALLIATVAFAFVLPTFLPGDWLAWMITAVIFAIAALGLHVLIGLSGQMSMGHAAIMALGGYSAAIFGTTYGLPAWITLPLAGIIAGLGGIIFAFPALRITGFYLVMVTMAAQYIIIWAIGEVSWTGGIAGIAVPQMVIGGNAISRVQMCWLALAFLVVITLFVKNFQRSNAGRRCLAMRDNELAAEVMGINLFRTKMLAFFLGCFIAGIAGWLWAHHFGYLSPEQFPFLLSLKFVGMLVIGGMGSTAGVLIGVVAVQSVDKLADYINPIIGDLFPGLAMNLGPSVSLMLFALLVILFVILEPHGLYGRLRRFRTWYNMYPFSY